MSPRKQTVELRADDVQMSTRIEARLDFYRHLDFLDRYHLCKCPDYQRVKHRFNGPKVDIVYGPRAQPSLATWWDYNHHRYKPEPPR
jgi:hypothetical protein